MDRVFEYLRIENDRPLGAGRLAPLIIMVNNDKKIVKELLDTNFPYYKNMWSFLDYVLNHTLKDDMDTIEYITFILNKFNSLDDKYNISGEEFIKIINEE